MSGNAAPFESLLQLRHALSTDDTMTLDFQ